MGFLWLYFAPGLIKQGSLFYFLRQRNRAVMPSDSGIWQGSLFYRNPLNFMIISDSSCLLFGPQALRVILFFLVLFFSLTFHIPTVSIFCWIYLIHPEPTPLLPPRCKPPAPVTWLTAFASALFSLLPLFATTSPFLHQQSINTIVRGMLFVFLRKKSNYLFESLFSSKIRQ